MPYKISPNISQYLVILTFFKKFFYVCSLSIIEDIEDTQTYCESFLIAKMHAYNWHELYKMHATSTST